MILLPTLNRPKLLLNFVESLHNTDTTTKGLILVDDKNYHSSIPEGLELPSGWHIVRTGTAVSMGDKCRFIWPEINAYPWVGLLNDDHYCVTKHWDQVLEAYVDGANMVSTDDGDWNFGFRVCGLTAWSMPLLDAVGFPIFPRNLQHLYIDDVWKQIGEATGCWLETNKISIEHRHVYNGKMAKDETFERVNAPPSWEYDAKEYKHFMEQDFKAVCERVVALRSQHIVKEKFV